MLRFEREREAGKDFEEAVRGGMFERLPDNEYWFSSLRWTVDLNMFAIRLR